MLKPILMVSAAQAEPATNSRQPNSNERFIRESSSGDRVMTGNRADQVRPCGVQPEKLTRKRKNRQPARTGFGGVIADQAGKRRVITSYSIHYTKLYERSSGSPA